MTLPRSPQPAPRRNRPVRARSPNVVIPSRRRKARDLPAGIARSRYHKSPQLDGADAITAIHRTGQSRIPPFALLVSPVHSPAMPELIASPLLRRIVVALILLFFVITNLPWRLDDYDQAKQAYTSFEMVQQGHWLYQHTPNESVATKPPLVGWLSAALFEITRWWEGAWRLPSLAAALLLLWLIGRDATAAYGAAAGLIALSAVGLNLLAPRLATLVRTDMPLALVTYLIGTQIWWKIRRAAPWTSQDRWIAFLLLTAAMLIKGPIVCDQMARVETTSAGFRYRMARPCQTPRRLGLILIM